MTEFSTEIPKTQHQYVTAFFDSQGDAEGAVERIVAEGVPRGEIQMVAGNEHAEGASTAPKEEKGFFEALGSMFMPTGDRHEYAEGLNRGGYLVSLNVTPQNRDRVLDILDDEGTVDMDARTESWRAEGWADYQADTDKNPDMSEPRPEEGVIEVAEEQLRVGKREVVQGRVRARSYVVETPVEEDINLREETVHVQRRAVDRPGTEGGDPLFAERSIEATETDEEAVVSKVARVTEEISLSKGVEHRTETIRDSIRHTEVDIDDQTGKRK